MKKERNIILLAGDSGTGKSFFVANLQNSLIFDTDIGGGLSAFKERIERNGSERIEVGSYLDVIDEIRRRGRDNLAKFTTLAIDHLTTLSQEAVIRYNPTSQDDFGKSYERARREWLKVRHLVRSGDYNLVCTSHMKARYESVGAGKKEATGITPDTAKNIEADFNCVLYLERQRTYPSKARVNKWRRDPDDPRGKIPAEFPFTMTDFLRINGFGFDGSRQEEPSATPAQITEFTRLLEVTALPEGTLSRWVENTGENREEWSMKVMGDRIAYMQRLSSRPQPP